MMNENNKKRMKIAGMAVFVMIIFSLTVSAGEIVNVQQTTVCCEKTNSGLFCQNVPATECSTGAKQAPTSCESTSYCKNGYCFDSNEGTCSDKVSQLVCNANNGVWSATQPAQCNLGCCVLGDQAAFVTLTRCKRLSSFLGLNTNFKTNIADEISCVMSVKNQDKGACVYDFEFERVCKFTTREECAGGIKGQKGEFFVNKLCSAEELGTRCGPTSSTMCVPGKDEVYFADSCGNAANIYDASKLKDKEYWSDYKDKLEACNPRSGNENSATCGNCNYLLGSFCRDAKSAGARATYGESICANLNCKKTSNGKSYKHGESWCVYENNDENGKAAGTRFYKHICINGEEVLEQCADFKAQVCIEGAIETSDGPFSQAACRVNRWQDCSSQKTKGGCENSDARDCKWVSGSLFAGGTRAGTCVPKVAPGLKFWTGKEAKGVCSNANDRCVRTITKKTSESEPEIDNEWCGSPAWVKAHADACAAEGDCSSKVNWIGQGSGGEGYTVTKTEVKE